MGGRGGSTYTQNQPRGATIIKKNPKLDTQALYKKDGQYSEERQKVHKRLINKIMRETSTVTKNSTLHIITGDSDDSIRSLTNEIKGQYKKIGTLNTGRLIENIPEYKQLRREGFSAKEASQKVVKEAQDIFNKAIRTLRDSKRTAIISMPISNSSIGATLIQGFKKKGYNVNLVYANGTNQIQITNPNLLARRDQRIKAYNEIKTLASRYNYYSTNGYTVTKNAKESYNPRYTGLARKNRIVTNITRSRGRILSQAERDRRNVERTLKAVKQNRKIRTTATKKKKDKPQDDYLKYIFGE